MAKARLDKTSGASGEIAALLRGRRDLGRWQTGYARLVNVVPLPEGAVQRRSGTRFVLPLKDETQQGLLFEFEAAADDNYMLVINGGAMRVMQSGGFVEERLGVPYELAVPFTEADLPKLQLAQSIDQVFIAWGGQPKVLTRQGPASWSIADYTVGEGPVRTQNTNKAQVIVASGVTGNITLSTTAGLFAAGHVGSVWRLDEGNLATIPAWKAAEATMVAGNRRRHLGRVYEVVSGTTSGTNAPVHEDGDVASGAGTDVVWRYIHGPSGYVRITGFTSANLVSATVITTLPTSVSVAGTFRWFEAAWSDVRGWPTSVALFDGRIVWASQNQIWASQTLDITSFNDTNPANGAWSVSLLSPDGKRVDIQWLHPAGVLVVGTRSGVWVLRGKDAYEALTTATLRAVPQSSRGSGPASAVMTEGGAIYVGRSRRDAYFAQFDAVAERVSVSDLTAFSRRILYGRAGQIADQRDPYRILWFRLEDGELRGLTFIPEQDNLGWCRLTMPGAVIEQVACVQSVSETLTEVWLIVRRTINGQTRRYVEQVQPFFVAETEDAPTAAGAWFYDCALRYQGAPVSSVSGLGHLEGQTVGIFADGDERQPATVTGGRVTLTSPASDVLVGLPIPWEIRTLPLELTTPAGTTAGSLKSTSRVGVMLHESAGGQIAQFGRPASDIVPLGRPFAGGPRALTSGTVQTTVEPSNDIDCALSLSGSGALPFTLLGIYPDVEAGNM
jgi:hypothetical protein